MSPLRQKLEDAALRLEALAQRSSPLVAGRIIRESVAVRTASSILEGEMCERCDGKGQLIAEGIKCPNCDGTGDL